MQQPKPTLAELQAYLDSDFIPPTTATSQATQPSIHLFTDLDWQTEEEPPHPAHPKHPQLYNLLTITQQVLIGYYPHDTHTLDQPNPHYIAWAPLHSAPTPILWS